MTDPSGLEPSLPSWNIEETAYLWRLDLLSAGEQAEFATQALMRGFDGPALRELLWSDPDVPFEKAFEAVGYTPPPRVDAVRWMGRRLAQDVLDGRRPVVEGAEAIVKHYRTFRADVQDLMLPDVSFWALDYWVDDWTYAPNFDEAVQHQEILELLRRLAAFHPSEPPQEDTLAPALGGTRAAPEPPPEDPPPADAWRFEFHFNFDTTLRRFLTWRWSWTNRRSR